MAIKIRFQKAYQNEQGGRVTPGTELTVTASFGRDLIEKGIAVTADTPPAQEEVPQDEGDEPKPRIRRARNGVE
jgi:hypothetical protein